MNLIIMLCNNQKYLDFFMRKSNIDWNKNRLYVVTDDRKNVIDFPYNKHYATAVSGKFMIDKVKDVFHFPSDDEFFSNYIFALKFAIPLYYLMMLQMRLHLCRQYWIRHRLRQGFQR